MFVLQAGAQTITLNQLSPNSFCNSGRDSFNVTWNSIVPGSNIVFYQSTNPSFNPYLGQGDSIGFIPIQSVSSGIPTNTTCPRILGIFIDACNEPPRSEPANEYILISSGNGFQVSNLGVDVPNNTAPSGGSGLPANSHNDINLGVNPCSFGTPSAALITSLRTGFCNASNLIPAGPGDSIPPGALVFIFTGNGTDYPYNFSNFCATGQKVYILQNACTRETNAGAFVNNAPSTIPACYGSTNTVRYRTTALVYGSCTDRLVYDRCGMPVFDFANPNAGDGNYVLHLENTDTSTVFNGGIQNNATDRCNGIIADSLIKSQLFAFQLTNGSGGSVNYCNTGTHYIKAITNPPGTQPVSNTLQFTLTCVDLATSVPNPTICSGQAAVVNNSSTNPAATFSWTVSHGNFIQGASAGSGTSINQIITNTGTQIDSVSYLITATDGGCNDSKTVKIYVNPLPQPFNLGNDTSYCSSFSRVLSTGNPNTVWSTGVTAPSITVTSAGTYKATVTNSCGSFTDSITISVGSLTFSFGTPTTTICNGSNISLDAGLGYDAYLWNTGATSHDIIITTPGKYWVRVTKNGCNGSDTINVIEIFPPVKPNLGNDLSFCGAFSQVLSTGVAGTQWVKDFTTPAGTGPSITVTQLGTYTATVSNSCGSKSDTIVISASASQPPIFLGNDTSYCGTFSRVLSTGVPSTVWSTGVTAPSITVTQPGTYWAKITGACGSAEDTIVINQAPGLNFSFGTSTTSVCSGSSISLDAGVGFDSYLWNTGATTHDIVITTPGRYWVRVTQNGCVGSDTIDVIQINPLTKPNLGRDTSFCGNFSLPLSTGNPQTNWFRNNQLLTVASSINATQTGTYIASMSNSCGAVADTIVISGSGQLNLDLGRDTFLCTGSTLTLNATVPGSGITYFWITGESTPTITVNAFGKYWVEVSNGSCTVSDTIFIDEFAAPNPINLGRDTSFCGAFSQVLFTGDVTTVWSTGVTDAAITVTQPGTYSAAITNRCGVVRDTINIGQFQQPVVDLGRDTSFCEKITLSVGNGNFISILWSTQETSSSIEVTDEGLYTVEVANTNCTKSDSIRLKKECFYDLYLPTAFSPNGDGVNDILVPKSGVDGTTVLEFMIFNRWGEKVFEASNFTPDDLSNAWDGTFKGAACQVDTYVFYYKARFPDEKEKSYKGTITLFR